MAARCIINLSEVSVAGENCQLCALLLRTAKRYCNDELNVLIIREGSALRIGSKGPRILRLCSDSECSAAPGNNIQIGFPLLPGAESPARFALLKSWLRWCDESHNCNKHGTKSKAALPTRLLHVGNSELDDGYLYCPEENDRVEYVALSHCWGKLADKDKRQFCTTDENIEVRLKRFSLSVLPKTFRDAVRVTRELGIQYLWIDSLCIIQWNTQDWEYEAKRMEGVFASAYCTIAATSAVDSNAGFPKRNVSNECVYVQDALGCRFYVCTGIDDFDNDVEKAPLNKRAWVMQERVLSRRTIHFTTNQAYFECGHGVYCENLNRLESSRRKTYVMLDPNFPHRLIALEAERTVEFIHFLFKEYSKRDLTVETDKCVAISGLEARIARARSCQSRYGIFQPYLHRNLLWQRPDNKLKRITYKNQHVPSWSWMAYKGAIEFIHIRWDKVDWFGKLQFDDLKHVLVTDVGVFQDCSLERRDTDCAILDSSKVKRGWIRYDVEEGEDLCKEQCVVVGKVRQEVSKEVSKEVSEDISKDKDKSIEQYFVLIVRPTSVDGEFRRVGVGLIQTNYVVRQRLDVRIV